MSVPFEGDQRGRIKLISKGAVIQLPAYGMESADETYEAGEEVVIIRMDGNSAEVVKPT